jgi:hypothetical protein
MDGRKVNAQRLLQLTRKAEYGVKLNIPNAYDMLELIDELNHVRGIVFEYRRSLERILQTASAALTEPSAADSRAAQKET